MYATAACFVIVPPSRLSSRARSRAPQDTFTSDRPRDRRPSTDLRRPHRGEHRRPSWELVTAWAVERVRAPPAVSFAHEVASAPHPNDEHVEVTLPGRQSCPSCSHLPAPPNLPIAVFKTTHAHPSLCWNSCPSGVPRSVPQ